MLHMRIKLKYALCFALSFAMITGVSFVAGLALNIQFAPPPVAQALGDLFNFTPIVSIVALVLGFIETFLTLWLALHHRKWLWPVTLILSVIFGGLASFFSLIGVWILVGLANLLLTWVMTRFLELRQLKAHD